MNGNVFKQAVPADMIPVHMGRYHQNGERRQPFHDPADIPDAQPRINEDGGAPSADKIAVRLFPMLRFADRKCFVVDLLDQKPIGHVFPFSERRRRPE